MSALSVSAVYERCPFLAQVAAATWEPKFEILPWSPSWPSSGTRSRTAAMLEVFGRTGGIMRSEEVLFLLRRRFSQPLSVLARWIVDRRIVSIDWQADRLVPLFQFDLADMSILPEAAAVMAELDGGLDEMDVASWFAEPHASLGGRTPVDALASDPQEVIDAARGDRFVTRG